jgi:hypothetical protein
LTKRFKNPRLLKKYADGVQGAGFASQTVAKWAEFGAFFDFKVKEWADKFDPK